MGVQSRPLIADRFLVIDELGPRGAGVGYRALDQATGALVAVSELHLVGPTDRAAFERQAEALAQLEVPGVAPCVAHGFTAAGRPFLATAWLAGRRLDDHLREHQLAPVDALALGVRVASALAEVHARGVVHGDIGSAHIVLVGGDPAAATLVDFRLPLATDPSTTASGLLDGATPYVAPEVAQSEAGGAAADVFGLGAVLFECLTGEPPFPAAHPWASLARRIYDDAPPLRQLRPDLSEPLAQVVAALLARDPTRRPATGREARDLLAAVRSAATTLPVAVPAGPVAGRRLRSVVRAHLPAPGAGDPRRVLAIRERQRRRDELRKLVAPLDSQVHALPDGTFVVTSSDIGSDEGIAARAAQAALAMEAALPAWSIDMATAWSSASTAQSGLDSALERVAEITLAAPREGVALDRVAAGLLADQFPVHGDEDGGNPLLPRLPASTPPLGRRAPTLGQPRPLLGREEDGELLERAWAKACSGNARAVLLSGPAGVGKTRMVEGFLEGLGLTERQVIVARGRRQTIASPLALIADALRRSAGCRDDDEPERQWERLVALLQRPLRTPAVGEHVAFLAEVLGLPQRECPPRLTAARRMPLLMMDQVQAAWVRWLDQETQEGPRLLLVEDAHWADAPSLNLLGASLRALGDAPLLILALARPSTGPLPARWERRSERTFELTALAPQDAERYARELLGDSAENPGLPAQLAAVGGYLPRRIEEAVRAWWDGRPAAPIAAVTADRVRRLSPMGRRLAGAAAVLGDTFWRSGLAQVVEELSRPTLIHWLAALEDAEIVAPTGEKDAHGDPQYRFEYAEVRDAAYGQLEPELRARAHHRAGRWLTKHGETDVGAIATHFEHGARLALAVGLWRRSARQALERGDFDAALDRVQRALDCGAEGVEEGHVQLVRAIAASWKGDTAAQLDAAQRAHARLPMASRYGYQALEQLISALGRAGNVEDLVAITTPLVRETLPVESDARHALLMAVLAGCIHCAMLGQGDLALHLLRVADAVAMEYARDPFVQARMAQARAAVLYHVLGDLGAAAQADQAAAEALREAGDARALSTQLANLAYAKLILGRYEEAERAARESLQRAQRLAIDAVIAHARLNLGRALLGQGRLDAAIREEQLALAWFSRRGDVRLASGARLYLAMMQLELGDPSEAARLADRASRDVEGLPLEPLTLAVLSQARLLGGDVPAAVAAAERAVARLDALRSGEDGEPKVRLALVEALWAAGDRGAARQALDVAWSDLQARAKAIADPRWRDSYLTRVPEHVRLADLRVTWSDPAVRSTKADPSEGATG